MHMVITVLVLSEDEDEALMEAKSVLDELCGDAEVFDYYTTFDGPGSIVSGKGRWGDLPACLSADSEEGKKWIEESWGFTKRDFMESFEKCKLAVALLSAEQVMEEEIPEGHKEALEKLLNMPRYWFKKVGQDRGPSVWLYDADGAGVTNRSYLDKILAKWDKEEYANLKVYAVPADVHF